MHGTKAGISGVPFFFIWFNERRTSTVRPDMPGIILLWDIFYNIFYTWHVFIHKSAAAAFVDILDRCCCCSSCCCSSPHAEWQKLLLVLWIWFHPVFSFSSFKHDTYFFIYPLAVLLILRPRVAHTTSSVLAGMRGAKVVVKPKDAKH